MHAHAVPMRARAMRRCSSSSAVRATRRLEVRSDDGGSYHIQARYLIDASGRDAFLAAKKKLRRKNPEHQSAAIFGHFRGAQTRTGEDAGNISMYRFAHGWMWMIPLPDAVMSVGAVCRPDYLKQRKGRTVEFLLETLKKNPALWQRIEHAELIDNQVRVTGNYSYDATHIGGRGWVLVGDAFAFLDPVFSSGVYPGDERRRNRRRGWWTRRCSSRQSSWRCCAGWRGGYGPQSRASRSSSTVSTTR